MVEFILTDASTADERIIGTATESVGSLLKPAAALELDIKSESASVGKLVIASSGMQSVTGKEEKQDELMDLRSQLKKSNMEKNVARSLLEKLQVKMKEEIEATKQEAFTISSLKLAEEQINNTRKVKEMQDLLEQMQKKQE